MNKLEFGTACIYVNSMCIPALTELKVMQIDTDFDISIDNDWWLRQNFPGMQINYIKKQKTTTQTADETDIKGIRPLCRFSSSDLKPGDEFILNFCLFKVAKPSLALCETVIGFSNFTNSEKTLKEWADIIMQNPGQRVLKVKQNKRINVSGYFSLLISENFFAQNLLATGVSYWVNFRRDEFSCPYINKDGEIKYDAISHTQHNICPVFIGFHEPFKELSQYALLEFKGRLFRVLDNAQALCLNPIGTSCYSTGICEVGTKDEELEFYKDSEAFKILSEWAHNND